MKNLTKYGSLIFCLFLSTAFSSGYEKTKDIKKGENLFNNSCASCHIEKIEEYSKSFPLHPRDLRLSLLSEEQMYLVTKKGSAHYGSLTGNMIGFEYIYTDDEVKDIVAYIHTSLNINYKIAKELYEKSQKIPTDKSKEEVLSNGKKIYLKRCIHCHGPNGKADGVAVQASNGNLLPYDLTKTLLTYEQKFLFTKYGSKHWGTAKNDMPAWGNTYDDYSIHSVIEYINLMIKTYDTNK
ncbi:MAG: cytochrome c [Arcobacteraceae bacterium]|nr:cytochrome c [Arcobacteraceae bacterium]MDY0328316.1 c-type cytochrome [Arcobacteraceae bacterium]